MKVRASAPGKLVVLGEYAVLTGAQALVMAVDRRCEVEIAAHAGPLSRLETRAPESQVIEFDPGQKSGLELVDTVRFGLTDGPAERPFQAVLDSSAFFAQDGNKLGLGSSAAVLTAWAGALQAYDKKDVSELSLGRLIGLHRALQGGRGSGIDVAAALHGGLSTFQLDSDDQGLPSIRGLTHFGSIPSFFIAMPVRTCSMIRRASRAVCCPLLS